MQETHEGIKRPRGSWSPDEEASKKKRTMARDKKSGSSATIKRRGSFQAHSQRKTRTARKKKTEKENKKQSKRTQAPIKPSNLSWHRQKKNLGEPEQRNTKKKNDNKRLSSWQNRISPRWERKGKSGTAKTVMLRRAYLSTSQRRWPTRDFQKNQNWKKERMRKTGNRTCRVKGTEQALFTRRQNRGTNGSLGRPELHYKRKG